MCCRLTSLFSAWPLAVVMAMLAASLPLAAAAPRGNSRVAPRSHTGAIISLTPGANGDSYDPAFSGNGRFVAFVSAASNLVPNDGQGFEDVFVRDLVAGTTQRVSVSTGGVPANDDCFGAPAISEDGRYVVFASFASNLVANDNNNAIDIFLRDRQLSTTTRISRSSIAAFGEADSDSTAPSISPDGRFVAFDSFAGNLVDLNGNSSLDAADDPNIGSDVFLVDLTNGAVEMISRATDGSTPNGDSFDATVSRLGTEVCFTSSAPLTGGPSTGLSQVFLRRRNGSPVTELRSAAASGGAPANLDCVESRVAAEGGIVTFSTAADNLVTPDTNLADDIFVNRGGSQTERVSSTGGGAAGNNVSVEPDLSSDGRFVAFSSAASDLVTPDANASDDIFVRGNGGIALISRTPGGAPGNGLSLAPSLSGNGSRVAFASLADNLVAADPGGFQDIFVAPNPLAVTLETVTPASARRGATVNLALHGSGFAAGMTLDAGAGVTFGTPVVSSAQDLTVDATVAVNAALGPRAVTVSGAGGTATLDGALTIQAAAAPVLTSINPTSGRQGEGVDVTLTGTDFLPGATPSASGADVTFSNVVRVSATTLTARIDVGLAAVPGARNITVTNGDGQSSTRNGAFTVVSVPQVSSITPATGRQGEQLSIQVQGARFYPGATLSLGSGIQVSNVSVSPDTTRLSANIQIGAQAAIGLRSVTVVNPDNQQSVLPDAFQVIESAVPATVLFCAPSFGAPGATVSATLSGTDFAAGATVEAGAGITATVRGITATALQVDLQIAAGAAPGLRTLRVTNPGAVAGSLADGFAVSVVPVRGKLKATPPRFAVTNTGQTGTANLVLRNNGRGAMVATVTAVSGPFTLIGRAGPYVLPPRGSVSVSMGFRPTAAGRAAGTATVSTDLAARPIKVVKLKGTGRVP